MKYIVLSLVLLSSCKSNYNKEITKENGRIEVIEEHIKNHAKYSIIRVDNVEYVVYNQGGIIKHNKHE